MCELDAARNAIAAHSEFQRKSEDKVYSKNHERDAEAGATIWKVYLRRRAFCGVVGVGREGPGVSPTVALTPIWHSSKTQNNGNQIAT